MGAQISLACVRFMLYVSQQLGIYEAQARATYFRAITVGGFSIKSERSSTLIKALECD